MKKAFCLISAVLICAFLASCSGPAASTVSSQALAGTPAPAESPTPTPAPTPSPSPVPTATPYLSAFGLTDATRNTKIDPSDIVIKFIKVNGVEKCFFTHISPLVNGSQSCIDIFTNELVATLYYKDGAESLSINNSFFQKRFNDSNVKAEFLNADGNFQILINRVKHEGYKVSEPNPNELLGSKSLEEIENWIEKYVPQPFWPVPTDYIFIHRTDSQIPRDRDNEQISSMVLRAIIITYSDEDVKIIFAERCKNDQGIYFYRCIFDNTYISDVKFTNENTQFISSIKAGGKIKDIGTPTFNEFIKLPLAQKLSGALTNLKPTDTIGYLRQAYEMLDDQYWYIPPKKN